MVGPLFCEGFANPLGVDEPNPRLSFKLSDFQPNETPVSYQISCGSGPGLNDLWDSGSCDWDGIPQQNYRGPKLGEAQRAYWRVAVTTSAGRTLQSTESTWEAGPGAIENWGAEWIQSDLAGGPRTPVPSPIVAKSFLLKARPVSARLYVATLGVYQARLNGKPASKSTLAPGWTNFRKRVRYQAFDVADYLTQGENIFEIELGDGWYAGHLEWRDRQLYGDRPKTIARLLITFADGSTEVIVTDESWKWTLGDIMHSDLMMGEAIDHRRSVVTDSAALHGPAWRPVEIAVVTGVELDWQASPLPEPIQEITPISVLDKPNWPTHRYLFDMGQNMVGHVRIKGVGEKGKTLTIRYAERLDDKGALYTVNYRGAKSTDYFTFASDEQETFETKFTFHGFQYVEISGLSKAPTVEDLTGVVVHSAWAPTGSFTCDDPLVSKLFENARWGWKGNSLDVPTDCPQRDERLGWTGDAQAFARTACFLGDVKSFYEKYLLDLEESQADDGAIPPFAPDTGVLRHDGGPAWADAVVIVPWVVYRYFGDKTILERSYETMARWVDSLKGSSRDYIRSFPEYDKFKGFGDWLNIDAPTPIDLIGTAFYAYSADLMAKIATVLGKTEDAAQYKELHAKVADAFQKRYITEAGYVASGSQTSYVLALYFDLMPPELRESAMTLLVADIEERNNKLSTGFVGAPYLLHVLSDGGRFDVAEKLLHQTEWPSWLYPVTQGATTIWERWDGWTKDKGFQDPGMNSFNHYAYGSVVDWIVSTVGGLDMKATSLAYREIVFKPQPTAKIRSAKTSLDTPYGRAEISWNAVGDSLEVSGMVPPSCTAALHFPGGGDPIVLGAGEFSRSGPL